jgi:hypothetical protein
VRKLQGIYEIFIKPIEMDTGVLPVHKGIPETIIVYLGVRATLVDEE